jgi:uncharacterized protein YkwD
VAHTTENISTGGDWKSAIDGWMASPAGHRTTLLNRVAFVGIGCATSSVGFATVPYWSLMTYYNGNMLFPS